jgi:hypothetical protein
MNIRAFLQQKTASFKAVMESREMQWSVASEKSKRMNKRKQIPGSHKVDRGKSRVILRVNIRAFFQ